MRPLRINETKLTSSSAFILDLFALGDEKESKYDIKPSFEIDAQSNFCKIFFVKKIKEFMSDFSHVDVSPATY